MKNIEKILHYLDKKWEKVQFGELKKDFSDINESTLIRNLNKLIAEKKLVKEVVWKNTFYEFSSANRVFEDIDVEGYFKLGHQHRNINESFNFEIFELLKNDIFSKQEMQKIQSLQTEFVTNFSQYDSQTLINKEFERIMIEFSWKSSAIEWNTYSLLATEALLKDHIPDATKTTEETQMILNHKDAFNETIQNKRMFHELQYQDIEYIHSVLTKKLWVTKNIRKSPVGITGTRYKPLDNEFQIKEALEKTVDLVNSKNSFFEKAFVLLIMLAYIQPFEDGNKRTSRMLSNAMFLSNNSIPLSYRIVDVVEYKKAVILFYEKNNISYLKQIFLEQFEDSVKNYFN